MIEKICESCGAVFTDQKHPDKRFCSITCRGIGHRKIETRECQHCGKKYQRRPSYPSRYCSHKCSTDANMRPPQLCETCGREYRVKYRKQRFCSHKCYAKWLVTQTGDKAGGWKDGSTKEHKLERNRIFYRQWRDAVFARDSWVCQDCGKHGDYLHAHHVFPFAEFPEHRFDIWNGTTLCLPCHAKIHPNLKKKVVEDVRERTQ